MKKLSFVLMFLLVFASVSVREAKPTATGTYDLLETESWIFSVVGDNDTANPVISGNTREISNIFYDSGDSNASRRYKILAPDSPYPWDDLQAWFSADGLTWELWGTVIDNDYYLQDAWIVLDGGMYYAFVETSVAGGYNNITRWNSTDFETWGNEVAILNGTGTSGDFDMHDCASPMVLVSGGTWYLFYEGMNREGSYNVGRIGYATSADGASFTRQSLLISNGDSGDIDEQQIVCDSIVQYGSYYLMACHCYDGTTWQNTLAYSASLTSGWAKIGRAVVYPDYDETANELQLIRDPGNSDVSTAYYLESNYQPWRGFPRASIAVDGTAQNSLVEFSSNWTLSEGIGTYIFGSNISGSWQNDTSQTMTSTWVNVTKTLIGTSGTLVEYQLWVTDASRNTFESEREALLVSSQNETFAPTKDSYVYDQDADVNYGTETTLICRKNPGSYEYETYVEFDISKIPTDVTVVSMELRLYCSVATTARDFRVYMIQDNSWTETGITWNNKPAVSGYEAEAAPTGTGWWNRTITTLWNRTDTVLGLMVDDTTGSGSGNSATYHSKENTYDPVLYVSYGYPPSNEACDSDTAFLGDTYGWSNVTVSESGGISDLTTVDLNISMSDTKFFILRWTQSTDAFSEVTDANDLCTINTTASERNDIDEYNTTLSYYFKISLDGTDGYCDVMVTSTDDLGLTDTDTYTEEFWFEVWYSMPWDAFTDAVNSIGESFGITGFLSQVSSLITALAAYLTDSITYVTTFIIPIFTFFTDTMTFVIDWFTRIVNAWVAIAVIVRGILDGTYAITTGVGSVWTYIGLTNWVDIVPYFMILAWFASIDNRAKKTGSWMGVIGGDLTLIMSVWSFIYNTALQTITTVIDLVFRFINAIPV